MTATDTFDIHQWSPDKTFYKNKLYKNSEIESSEKISTNYGHFEAGKFGNKKLK